MAITARQYQGDGDLRRIQAATAEWIASAGFLGYMNVSDIALRLFNGMRKYAPNEIVRLWEDDAGELVGWAMAYPAWSDFEALLRPDLRKSRLAEEIIDWAEHETISQMQKAGLETGTFRLLVFDEDLARTALLEGRGYARGEHRSTISICPLDETTPQAQLPEGFAIRSVRGRQDIEKLVTLINDSFNWSWTADAYEQVTKTPGYEPDNELVVVAPDGRFAASLILLPDSRNRTGMFENVGTSRDFRRMGLARSLLHEGMQRMKAQGFMLAMVPHAVFLGPASALYASAGFKPAYQIFEYSRLMNESAH